MSELTHQQAKKLIQAARGGTMTQPEQESLVQHLDACSGCRAYAGQMDELEGNLRRTFHARWDASRVPAAGKVETINQRTNDPRGAKNLLGFATGAVSLAVIVAFAILAISLRSKSNAALPGASLQAATLTASPAPTGVQARGFAWAPPDYATPGAPKFTTDELGSGVCREPISRSEGTGSFIWPADQHTISGNDYSSNTLQHHGIDLAGAEGDPAYAADGGTVVFAGWNNMGYGNMVVIDHGRGRQSLYAHLSKVEVVCGQQVAQGSPIGQIGSSGNINGTWLHFEIIINNAWVNPHDYLPAP